MTVSLVGSFGEDRATVVSGVVASDSEAKEGLRGGIRANPNFDVFDFAGEGAGMDVDAVTVSRTASASTGVVVFVVSEDLGGAE